MKYLDKVKVIKLRERYKSDKITLGEIGVIWEAEIRDNCFYVAFETGDEYDWYKYSCIEVEDIELMEEYGCTDDMILDALPKNDPRWWCKVEDGYIMNLLGEKKNKIPYKYDS